MLWQKVTKAGPVLKEFVRGAAQQPRTNIAWLVGVCETQPCLASWFSVGLVTFGKPSGKFQFLRWVSEVMWQEAGHRGHRVVWEPRARQNYVSDTVTGIILLCPHHSPPGSRVPSIQYFTDWKIWGSFVLRDIWNCRIIMNLSELNIFWEIFSNRTSKLFKALWFLSFIYCFLVRACFFFFFSGNKIYHFNEF